jgi:carboxylesterase type B
MTTLTLFTAFLISLLLLPSNLALPTTNGRPSVTIDSGVVLGITKTENQTGLQLNVFLGVPFAAKPVRWAPAKPPTPWTTPFDASKYGPACIQQFNYPAARRNLILQWFNTPAPQESEDCLNACVYAPLDAGNDTKKAVMVWFYGGALLYGSNAQPLYDGSALAAHEDVIVVAINYVGGPLHSYDCSVRRSGVY